MTTIAIPANTYDPGGPYYEPSVNGAAIGNFSKAEIDIDRTVTGGLNSLDANTEVTVAIEQSPDGTTWRPFTSSTWEGGIQGPKPGQTGNLTTNQIIANGPSPTSTRARVAISVGGPNPVAVVIGGGTSQLIAT